MNKETSLQRVFPQVMLGLILLQTDTPPLLTIKDKVDSLFCGIAIGLVVGGLFFMFKFLKDGDRPPPPDP